MKEKSPKEPLTTLLKVEEKPIIPTHTQKELATAAGVGQGTYYKGTVILDKGTPEQIEAINNKETTINAVYKELKKAETVKEQTDFANIDKIKDGEPEKKSSQRKAPEGIIPTKEYTTSEAAELIGIKDMTLKGYLKPTSGRLDKIKRGNKMFVLGSEIIKYIEKYAKGGL